MPRTRRASIEVATFDPLREELDAMLRRLGLDPNEQPTPDPDIGRRLAKYRRAWDAMTAAERAEWCTALLREERRYNRSATLPKRPDELRERYALSRLIDRWVKKSEKQTQRQRDAFLAREAARVAAIAEAAAARRDAPPEPAPTRATRPVPAFDEPGTGDEPRRRRKRRRGPAVGSVGFQLPGGVFVANDPRLYDGDGR